MKRLANPLKPGDVIRTHPGRGYWGCAIVLSARDSTAQFHPMCHIGTTTLIRPRRYSWKSIDPAELEIASLVHDVRVAPNEYYRAPTACVCIGIYTLKSANGLDIIGRVDPKDIYQHPLAFKVGDGTSGAFPLCGPIPDDLGHEAVIIWRRAHDAVRLEQEARKDMEWFENYEEQRLAAARQTRKSRTASNSSSIKPKPLRGSG